MKKTRVAQIASATLAAGGAVALLMMPATATASAEAYHQARTAAVSSHATAPAEHRVIVAEKSVTLNAAPVAADRHIAPKPVTAPRPLLVPKPAVALTSAVTHQPAVASKPLAVKAVPHIYAAPAPRYTTIKIGNWSKTIQAGGQSLVNSCRVAVLWTGPMPGKGVSGTSVIVGHNYCGGFSQFAKLRPGTVVTITGPHGTQRYRVYANRAIGRQGGSAVGLFRGDLTLQSCLGSGTGFSYAKKI